MAIWEDDEQGSVQQTRAKQKTARELELDDLKKVLSLKEGRRLIWRIIQENCGVMRPSAHASGSQTYTNEGRRSVGLDIINEMDELDVQTYAKLIIEMKEWK